MTKPSGPVLGLVHLDDSLHTRYQWTKEVGIGEPGGYPAGSVQQTFAGGYRVSPAAYNVPTRSVGLVGFLERLNGQQEGYARFSRLLELSRMTAGAVSRFQVGSLFMQLVLESPSVEDLRSNSSSLLYGMTGTAVPGAWQALYGVRAEQQTTFTGANATNRTDLGVTICADQPAALEPPTSTTRTSSYTSTVTSGVFQVWNYGDLPAAMALTVYIAARTTTFYVRVMKQGYNQRIAVTPSQGGVAVIRPEEGLWVPPGITQLRLEEANGSTVSTAATVNWYGTVFFYNGMDDQRATEWPVLYNSRPSRAYYSRAAATSTDQVLEEANGPRVGMVGPFTSSSQMGHVVEGSSRNQCIYSQDLSQANWVKNNLTALTYNNAAPDGTSTAAQATGNAADSYVTQTGLALVAGQATFSVWLRGTSSGSVNIYLGDSGGSSNVSCSYTTTWTRFDVTHNLTTGTSVFVQIGGGSTWAIGEVVQIWGCQAEQLQHASSYIPTVSVARNRDADVLAFVQPLHNLVAWSNRFDKTTAVAGTRGLWYTTGTFSATRQTGPGGPTDAWQWTGGAAANTFFEQALVAAEDWSRGTVHFSIWLKSTAAGSTGYNVDIRILDGTTQRGLRTVTIFNTWTRYCISAPLVASNADRDVRVQVRETTGGSRVFQVFGAQVVFSRNPITLGSTTGYAHANPYLETLSQPVYPDNGSSFPWHLTQNGFIQMDVMMHKTDGNPATATTYGIFNCANTSSTSQLGFYGPAVFRSSAHGSGVNTVRASIWSLNSAELSSTAVVTVDSTPASTIFSGTYKTVRLEWVNYLVAGVRTIQATLTVDGTSATVAATSGHDKWAWGMHYEQGPHPSSAVMTNLMNDLAYLVAPSASDTHFLNIKNLSLGCPSIPAGAIPEPY